MTSTLPIVIGFSILGAITFFYRYSFISSQGRKYAEKVSPKFLRLLGPATFSAIIANNILGTSSSQAEFQQKVVVGVLALVVAYFSKSVMLTLVFGLGLLFILQNFVGWPTV